MFLLKFCSLIHHKTKGFKSMKYVLIFVVVFYFPSSFARICKESFSIGGIDKQEDFLRKADKELEKALRKIRKSPEEPVLKVQGFKPTYYKGVDQAREFNEVAKYLRAIQADPEKTHISYFASQIEKTLTDFEKSLRQHNQDKPEFLAERLKLLEALKTEAQRRVADQNVTYNWWADFNLRLSMITLNSDLIREYKQLISGHKQISEESFFNLSLTNVGGLNYFAQNKKYFPQKVMFFTTDELGIMAFNKLEDRSYFIGVSGIPVVADGKEMSPLELFSHDIDHAVAGAKWLPHNILLKRIESISSRSDREKAEAAFFIYRHEVEHEYLFRSLKLSDYNKIRLVSAFLPKSRQLIADIHRDTLDMMLKKEFKFLVPHNLQEMLPENVNVHNKEEVKVFVTESASVFADILLARYKN